MIFDRFRTFFDLGLLILLTLAVIREDFQDTVTLGIIILVSRSYPHWLDK